MTRLHDPGEGEGLMTNRPLALLGGIESHVSIVPSTIQDRQYH